MASLEDETEETVPGGSLCAREEAAMASRERPPLRAVLGTNWAHDKVTVRAHMTAVLSSRTANPNNVHPAWPS
jgi:hypothetical protein